MVTSDDARSAVRRNRSGPIRREVPGWVIHRRSSAIESVPELLRFARSAVPAVPEPERRPADFQPVAELPRSPAAPLQEPLVAAAASTLLPPYWLLLSDAIRQRSHPDALSDKQSR